MRASHLVKKYPSWISACANKLPLHTCKGENFTECDHPGGKRDLDLHIERKGGSDSACNSQVIGLRK